VIERDGGLRVEVVEHRADPLDLLLAPHCLDGTAPDGRRPERRDRQGRAVVAGGDDA
jgi:hypothetical protein